MKAAVCYGFGAPLVVEDLEVDQPGDGEVRVKLAACAICHSDIHYMEGAWGGELPSVFGHEAAGVVEVVGPGVTRTNPGDHVIVTLMRSCGYCHYCAKAEPHLCETEFALDRESRLRKKDGSPIKQGLKTGAFAEIAVVDQSQVAPIPSDLPLDCAALLACGVITGLGAVVNTARVPAGSSAVVIGTGGVGLNSVQGAALCGANPIVALDLEDAKLEAARSFGATHTVNPQREDAEAAVKAATNGRGADFVFVTVGSIKALEQGIDLLGRGGTLVVVGMPASGMKAAFEVVEFADDSQKILGSKMGSTRLPVDIPKLVDLYRQGRLKLDELVTGRYPLEQINEAIAEVKRSEALRNVIVF